ncbi:relaxase/mobilization nuclease domain-containing protein [Methylobacterium sp. NEAU 140]|nr:relaxase/mobilization nuclease domain-containing protein [Methylobacterium sp. NEAU 140]MDP4026622.1 relaxase/mobilization nuclease domain-containing protein [Methylobacterium sp. NEAU 140]
MVPNVAKAGASFRGAFLYYLHDKREAWEAERMTADRVSWTKTRNLATDNPDLAWRIMAATAKDQDRLKAEAGVKNTGRKSPNSVYAYSLAWHPDEAKHLSKSEMLRAADESIRVLGAENRQAIIVCHRDEPHPHVHVILNRVDPDTGRMLTNSKDFVRLSQWAEAYERERGRIWCGARVENNAKRAKGDFVRASSPTPRSMEQAFDQARGSNDNQARRARDEAKIRTAKLASDSAGMSKRHGVEWDVLRKAHQDRKDAIYDRAKERSARVRSEIKDSYAPVWRDLYRQQHRERRSFDAREKRLAGKIANALDAIRHRRDLDPENSRGWVSAAFRFVTSREARAMVLTKVHEREKRELKADEKRALDKATLEVRRDRQGALSRSLDVFGGERTALIARQTVEKDEMKGRWRDEHDSRTRAFGTIVQAAAYRKAAQAEATPRERFEAQERGDQFRNAAEGNARRMGRVRRRTRRRDE